LVVRTGVRHGSSVDDLSFFVPVSFFFLYSTVGSLFFIRRASRFFQPLLIFKKLFKTPQGFSCRGFFCFLSILECSSWFSSCPGGVRPLWAFYPMLFLAWVNFFGGYSPAPFPYPFVRMLGALSFFFASKGSLSFFFFLSDSSSFFPSFDRWSGRALP